ncbi:hypothetical protein [Dongia sp.]|uniref:hypothetical protein n=1 Tax=Dongia sp. TaxID=1977262 RepID=UPI0035B21B33
MRTYTVGYRKAGHFDHRRDKRLRLPVFSVKVGQERYDSINWSLGGILVGNYNGYLFQGMSILINVQVKADMRREARDEDGLTIEALVIRHDLEKRELALKFQRLTPTILDFFERSFNFHNRAAR